MVFSPRLRRCHSRAGPDFRVIVPGCVIVPVGVAPSHIAAVRRGIGLVGHAWFACDIQKAIASSDPMIS